MAVEIGSAYLAIMPSLKGFGTKLNAQLGAEMKGAGAKVGQSFGGSFLGSVKKFAGPAAAALGGLSVARFGADSVKMASDFQSSMSTIGVTLGTTGQGVKELTDLAKKMGAETSFSAQGASDAMLELAKGGLSEAEIKAGALSSTLTLATAGGLDLGNAASYVVQGMSAFGLKAEDAGAVTTALAGAANASTASVESMGQALSQVGAGAKTAGLSLQDTTAALAAFDNAGIKGSDAGTSLKTFLQNLVPMTDKSMVAFEKLGLANLDVNKSMEVLRRNGIKPLGSDQKTLRKQLEGLSASLAGAKPGSEKAEKAFRKLALETGAMDNAFFDAKGNVKDMSSISQTLQDTLKDQTKAQKIATLTTLFGSDASRAAAVLAENGAAGMEKYVKATNDKSQADKMAANATSGFKGAMERLQGAVDTAKIALGTQMLPVLTKVADFLSEKAMPALMDFAGDAKDAFVDAKDAIGGFFGFLKDNEGTVKTIATIVGVLLAPAFASMAVSATVSAATQTASWIATQASAVKSAAVQFASHYRVVAGWVMSAGAAIKSGAQTVAIWAMLKWDAIKAAAASFAAHVRMAAGWVLSKAAAVKSAAQTAAIWLGLRVQAAAGAAAVFAAKVREAAAWTLSKGAMLATAAAQKAVTAAQWLLNAAMTANPIGLIIAGLVLLGAGLVLAYKRSETFRAIVDKTFTWIKANVPKALNAAKDGVVTAWNAIRGAFSSAWGWVKSTFSKAWAGAKWLVLTPITAARDGVRSAWDWIKAKFTAVKDWVLGTFSRAWSAVKEKIRGPISSARDAISSILGSGKNGLRSIFSTAVSAISRIWDGLKSAAKAPIRFIVQTVLEDGLLAAFRWVSDKVGYDAGKNLHVSLPRGFSSGGWTGPGSKYTPAGIVHADEYVIKKESRRKIERDHPGLLDSLNGYANGGLVASPGDRGGFLTGGRQPVPGAGHRHSGYGWARWAGDFPVGMNTPVHAYKAGIVSAVRYLTTSYGKHVRINHAGEETLYAHLNSIGVKVGQQVAAGQVIGRSGSTGNSTGPHVHFELKGGNSALSNTTGGGDSGDSGFDFLGALKERFAGPMNRLKEIGDSPFAEMVKAIPGKLKDALIDKATGAFGALTGAVGDFSNKADIASVLTNALIMNGLPLTQLDNWMRQVQSESGGNPNAVQGIQDVNSRSGNLAQGLLQVIPPTFAAYRSKLLPNNPFNPLANAYAAMNYAKHRYGRNGIEGVIGHGHGYATGTSSASPGLHWVGERGPELMRFRGGERVYNASESAKIAGGAGRELHVHGNVYGDDFEQRIFDEWDRRDRRARTRANFDSLAGFPG